MSFYLEDTDDGVDLVITGDWTAQAASCLENGTADGLVLNYARGFRERDLDFLRGLPVRRLNVLARAIIDLSPVYDLVGPLESLQVQTDPGAVIELERLPSVRQLSAAWRQIRGSIRYAERLERLFILSYSAADLTPLSTLTNLVSVRMKHYPHIRALDGFEELPLLTELGIYLSRNLEDISVLGRSTDSILQVLHLPSCRRIFSTDVIDVVSNLPLLRFLDLADGAEIKTLAPIERLVELEKLHLYGSTKIADGDLSPVLRLPKLTDFKSANRRGYSPSVAQIQEILKSRTR